MNKLIRIATILSLTLVFSSVKAQTVSPVDFMRTNPYQMKTNPAADLPYESVMSILIGDIGYDFQNTSLHYNNLFDFNLIGQPTAINLRKFADSFKKDNYLGFGAHVDFFTLYRRLNKGMLTVNYGFKVQSDVKYNNGLFKLLGYGNSFFVGEDNPVDISMNVNATAYQEVAVGYQLKINEKLSLGARAKLLLGMANVTTDACSIKLFTDPDSYALRLRENVAMRACLPRVLYVNEEGQFMANGRFGIGDLFNNPGLGFDLGAEYRINDQFSVMAAVNDLGFIHWGLNDIGFTSQLNDAGQFYDDGDFLFNGLNAEQWGNIISDQSYREQFLDTLSQYFQLGFAQIESYNRALNTNMLLRGSYDLDPNNRFSAQLQGCFYGSGFRPAMTLAYNGYFFEMLDLCVTYTMMPHSYGNFGLGLSVNLFDTCNIYLATNNAFAFFRPLNAKGLNGRMGIVFTLNPKVKNDEFE